MSQLTKLTSKLTNLSIGSVCNNSIHKTEFSNLGNKSHCGLASFNLTELQTAIMSCPPDLQDQIGTDKYYAETDGFTITAVAATMKLLAEERLRRDTNTLKVPIGQILKENHHRSTPSHLMVKMILSDL